MFLIVSYVCLVGVNDCETPTLKCSWFDWLHGRSAQNSGRLWMVMVWSLDQQRNTDEICGPISSIISVLLVEKESFLNRLRLIHQGYEFPYAQIFASGKWLKSSAASDSPGAERRAEQKLKDDNFLPRTQKQLQKHRQSHQPFLKFGSPQ